MLQYTIFLFMCTLLKKKVHVCSYIDLQTWAVNQKKANQVIQMPLSEIKAKQTCGPNRAHLYARCTPIKSLTPDNLDKQVRLVFDDKE